MKYNNVLVFEPLSSDTYDAETQRDLLLWVSQVGANLMTKDGYNIAPSNFPSHRVVGSWYYYLLNEGLLAHKYGVDNFNHYVEMPLSWLTEEHHTEEQVQYDDEGVELAPLSVSITNEEYYTIARKNTANCLLKITDKQFTELFALITFTEFELYGRLGSYPINMLCSDKYKETIDVGGSYYAEPVTEVID